jgi:hypothetical protein
MASTKVEKIDVVFTRIDLSEQPTRKLNLTDDRDDSSIFGGSSLI